MAPLSLLEICFFVFFFAIDLEARYMTYSLLNEELNKPRILQKTQDVDEFGKGSNKNSTPRFLSLEFLRVICQKAGRVKL